jgi:hypothetical protein
MCEKLEDMNRKLNKENGLQAGKKYTQMHLTFMQELHFLLDVH